MSTSPQFTPTFQGFQEELIEVCDLDRSLTLFQRLIEDDNTRGWDCLSYLESPMDLQEDDSKTNMINDCQTSNEAFNPILQRSPLKNTQKDKPIEPFNCEELQCRKNYCQCYRSEQTRKEECACAKRRSKPAKQFSTVIRIQEFWEYSHLYHSRKPQFD